MARTIRKQTHADYTARVARVNKAFYRNHRDTAHEHPVRFALLGFVWFYMVLSMATRKPEIVASLKSGSLPANMHNFVLAAMAVTLGMSIVLWLVHLLRFAIRVQDRRNSGGVVLGSLLAVVLVLTPASILQSGFGVLGENTRTALARTQSHVRNIDWNEVVLTSSQAFRSK